MLGGPEGKEAVLVGLRDGAVVKIFVDNPFPVQIIKQDCIIRQLDVSYLK